MRAREINEKLPTGKFVTRVFDEHENLIEESHGYGHGFSPVISISRMYVDGMAVKEIYLVNYKPVTKKKYEEIRLKYSDMPAAGEAMDLVSEMRRGEAEEHKIWIKKFRAALPDNERAERSDKSCRQSIESKRSLLLGDCDNEVTIYFKRPPGRKAGVLKEKLKKQGVSRAWLIDVDHMMFHEPNKIGCRGLVLELPEGKEQREAILIMADKIARKEGFEGPMDDGQSYVFVNSL